MASSLSTSPDTLVTLKVNLDGASRRFKLPLRDLALNVIDAKLRQHLEIPEGTDAVFERYSDSAGSYVVLDETKPAIYKQLYRAAKAKQKLKLRVTLKEPSVEEEIKGPKPASVEDETEEETAEVTRSTSTSAETEEPVAMSSSPSAAQDGEKQADAEAPEVVTETLTTPATGTFTVQMDELSNETRAPKAESPELPVRPWQFNHPEMCTHWDTITRTQKAVERSIEAMQASMSQPPTVQRTTVAPVVHTAPSLLTLAPRATYAVCCNSCDRTIPEAHYHCSTCHDGDFDLCQDCVDQGITCFGDDHWLIKRFVKNGVITNSTTERIAPKPKPQAKQQPVEQAAPAVVAAPVKVAPASSAERMMSNFNEYLYSSIRTCNCCVSELPETEFVHCTTCEDFDLCRTCFAKNRHGHHPNHGFVPAVEGTRFEPEVSRRLAPGRSQFHNAICDGCDDHIKGIRHKCLDCPDWDYCSSCRESASMIHPGHRFVPIYEPLEPTSRSQIRAATQPVHFGVCCDGPLCSTRKSTYISGDRYKCAVCHDTDFCATCEASPANTHNRTHPLIKFKTPVRHVSVTTTGEHENGRVMPAMGDRIRISGTSATSSRATETPCQNILATNMMTVVDVQPTASSAPVASEEQEIKIEEKEEVKPKVSEPPVAVFVRDQVADGTVFGPDHVFEQTWVLRNDGNVPWPAGCSVKYVGGDYMGHVDSTHPAATRDLESSAESTICYSALPPGEEFPFTVLLRTPQRSGRLVSNWRLTSSDGTHFGHRLWCDVIVEKPKTPAPSHEDVRSMIQKTTEKVESMTIKDEEEVPCENATEEVKVEEAPSVKIEQSQMIFPKLEKESPVSSIHEEARSESAPTEEEYEDCAEDDEWAEDDSDSGFLTDEEYDVLDASDEEYNGGQQGKLLKK
ncbi:hypothetical protein B0T19DRAFT_400302 [Cercophora scortea]|uniref:ZZ-type domain-containing protein n=1 Tax=Cercophora scortea TaxID=314031 RepID=A0AAE0ILQ7_9PEZI|nr:hypothetical protein B0T19DRAFT_400302 [Cercophora scortea]